MDSGLRTQDSEEETPGGVRSLILATATVRILTPES